MSGNVIPLRREPRPERKPDTGVAPCRPDQGTQLTIVDDGTELTLINDDWTLIETLEQPAAAVPAPPGAADRSDLEIARRHDLYPRLIVSIAERGGD